MKLLRKLMCLVVAMIVLISGMTAGVAAAAGSSGVLKPGLDIIILLDISYSNFPGMYADAYDPDIMCLDAAAMLVNMCDSVYSRVAVVPFTNVVPDQNGWWKQWIDVSNSGSRKALCDELYSKHMVSMDDANWHRGNTNQTVALKEAMNLMNTRTTNNPVLVVMLGDSDFDPNKVNIEECVELAEQIKSQNAYIYCLDMGEYEDVEETLLYRVASGDAGSKEDYYWSDVMPSDLKIRFSDIFAEMIGSTRFTESAHISGDSINFELYIPNKSVTEVNLVLDRSYMGDSGFDLILNDTTRNEDDNLLIYSKETPVEGAGSYSFEALTYDFISIKLINPDTGEWLITAAKGEGVDENTPMSYDILFNYQIEPTVYDMGDPFYQSETVHFVSNFINTEDGSASTDEALYRGDSDPKHPGIEAMLTVFDAEDAVVGSYLMTPNQGELNFSYDFDLDELGDIPAGVNKYSYEVNVRGDNMNKTSARASFSVENTCPKAVGLSEIDWSERLEIVNIFDEEANSQLVIDKETISSYFTDDDGDVLTYSVAAANNVTAKIDNNGVLTVEKADNEVHDDAYVTVRASDSAGQYADIQFNVDVLSVKELVEECVEVTVQVESSGEGFDLVKGDTVSMTAQFNIVLPEGADKNAFPYNYLSETITPEKLAENSVITFDFDVNGDINCTDNGSGDCTLTIGSQDGATVSATATADIGMSGNQVTKTFTTDLYTVKNAAPQAEDITDALLSAGAAAGTDADGNPVVYFELDKDHPDANKLSFDVSAWFTDADVDNGSDQFTYTVTVEPLEETADIFSFARTLLRMIGLTEKDGPVVEVVGIEPNEKSDDDETGADVYTLDGVGLNFGALRFGNAKVIVSASDGVESVDQSFEYRIASSVEQIKCIIVYAILLIILIVIIIVLINKLVIHQPWPSKRQPGYSVQLNGFDQMTMTGQLVSPFLVTGRKERKLSDLAKNFSIADDGVGNSIFANIILWPTMGGNIAVELSKKAKKNNGVTIRVAGQPLNKKRMWTINSQIVITYSDNMGADYECVFKR